MKPSKSLLLFVAFVSLALLGAALYLQYGKHMQPCPLCIIQRYAFAALALLCILFAILPQAATRFGAGLATLAALAGAGTAIWHLWVVAHPGTSCGIDPMETALNHIPTARLMPFLFNADGFCTTPYAPIFGLSIPAWSLIWFLVLALMLGRAAFARR
ncbi:MAG TPA: disulfide bond formation protein B [Herbaspirillum sp.]|jgi:disulfide bond formation protein DsbB|nr:disulfide bond formation protein B [Herbaspirillum sp.]